LKLPRSRILPLAAVAVTGVLAVNALSGVAALPDLLSGARAWAEEATKEDPKDHAADAKAGGAEALAAAAAPKPVAACAPTAAELARQAGLTPAELQLLQSLQARRGQLDSREQELDGQLQLLTAAEAKVDVKLRALTSMRDKVDGLKGDIQKLLGQTDAQAEAETLRMVAVFTAMKPKDAAARFSVLDDSVRLPIAAKMKERTLAAIMSQMSPPDAKALTEKLAARFATARAQADSLLAANPTAAPERAAAGPAAPGAGAKPISTAANAPAPGAAKPSPAKPTASAAPPATPPGKSG
jgi:flagellar motility protein MotE (MotC chaperone)